MKSFWKKIQKPVFVLAPMDDVTDTVFRQVVADAARPDVFFTEFVNCDGLVSSGRKKLLHKLEFSAKEKPIVAQIWGVDPENYYRISKELSLSGFDGIDINMGCPQRDVIKTGACAALIENKERAAEIIEATKRGAGGLPVSVKTRIGIKKIQTEEWIGFLLKQDIDALTIHGRTAAEMSKSPVHWDEIGKAVKLKNKISPQTVLLGNGDVKNKKEGLQMVQRWGVDGVMIGRGIFNDLLAFELSDGTFSSNEKLELLKKHINLFEKTWGKNKNPQILKKFFKIYVNEFEGAGELRVKLMDCRNYLEMKKTLSAWGKS